MKPSSEPKKPNKFFLWAKRILTVVFSIAVPVFLILLVKNVDWQDVKKALFELDPKLLALGFVIGAGSYLAYSSYDLIGRRYTGHSLPARQVLAIAFVCYAFTLNLGAWAGTFALRFRLYSRLGLDTPTITKIFTLTIITNWLGYVLLGGVIFSAGLVHIPDTWKLGDGGVRLLGVFLLLLPTAYWLACAFAKRRNWRVFGQEIELPGLRFALVQTAIASLNWSLMALIVFTLFHGKVAYPVILGGLLLSSIAGAITHVPGGLGVLEAIFVALLGEQVPKGTVLATLIGYRVIYYLIPLAVAAVSYLIIEGRAKKMRAASSNSSSNSSASNSSARSNSSAHPNSSTSSDPSSRDTSTSSNPS